MAAPLHSPYIQTDTEGDRVVKHCYTLLPCYSMDGAAVYFVKVAMLSCRPIVRRFFLSFVRLVPCRCVIGSWSECH